MSSPNSPFHIVTTLRETRGNEHHAQALCSLLRKHGAKVALWSDTETDQVTRLGGKAIAPFSGQIPRGGTLIILGTWVSLHPWIDHVRPKRLILICNLLDSASLCATLTALERPTLPKPELVFVSQRLKDASGLPGVITPILIDQDTYTPAAQRPPAFTIGRMSRDAPEKHHPDDPSLYRMLAWSGTQIRIMGGSCLASAIGAHPQIALLPLNAEPPVAFLHSLDVFFYRTDPSTYEAAGRVIMEALMCGLAVVADVNGGYADWIRNGENGYLFSAQEEAWEYCALIRQDQSLRTRLQQQARASALEFAGEAACQTYVAWLQAEKAGATAS
ncbi:MAG TPA: glycosyltransferase [Rhodocyclaceae bacterium]|nr:glycosyltransferase [Rhodocyclaceae bacterium]